MQGSARLLNCRITDNVADFVGGGISTDVFSGEVSDCAIVGNAVDYGGGLALEHYNSQAIGPWQRDRLQ